MLVTSSLALSSPTRRLDCADDPSFSIAGDHEGVAVDWVCGDFRGFSCGDGGWGVAAADGPSVVAACPQSCADGACPTPICADDADFRVAGVDDDGKAVEWKCADWLTYACLDGGWGLDDGAALLAACPQSCSDGACYVAPAGTAAYEGSYSYDGGLFSYGDDYEPPKPHSQEDCQSLCKPEWLNDGECDYECNALDCGWDGNDCYHGNTGCYVHPTGADYRGMANTTVSGKDCQYWSSLWPNEHTYVPSTYPDANLGGHNHCRNPETGDGSTGPWCMVNSFDVKWEYCDVGPVHDACDEGDNGAPSPHTLTPLTFGEWVDGDVYEHMYVYYSIEVSASLQALEVVIVPESGDPDMYVSFDNRFPTGHNYSYVQDDVAVDIFRITRGTFGFCGAKGTAAGGKVDPNAACTLYVSVTGFEASKYHIVAYDVSDPKANHACADGCNWKSLGDGECQPQCNVASCYFDRGDCTRGPNATHCRADCTREWLDDGYCDEACFNAKCGWDGDDCGGAGCADACLPGSVNDGECDAECNVESCGWDGSDCFHSHDECYQRSDGADYRGTVSHTKSGHVCQAWSAQYPKVHTRTHDHYPRAGLGGHNYCRNPDGDDSPWCYPIDSEDRYEICDVGPPSDEPCARPPPPPKRHRAPRPPPPFPHPPPTVPPPKPCPEACDALGGNGACDQMCNVTTCLWDKARAPAAARPRAP